MTAVAIEVSAACLAGKTETGPTKMHTHTHTHSALLFSLINSLTTNTQPAGLFPVTDGLRHRLKSNWMTQLKASSWTSVGPLPLPSCIVNLSALISKCFHSFLTGLFPTLIFLIIIDFCIFFFTKT